MKTFAPFVAVLTTAALLCGCGGGSGVKFSDLFDDSAAAEGTGIQGYALVRAVVILATHDATARQRQVAEQNGRRAVAKLKAQMQSEQTKPAPKPSAKPHPKKSVASGTKPKTGTTTSKPAAKIAEASPKPAIIPEPEPAVEPAATPKPKPPKKLPRIIAVTTEKNDATDKKAAKAIMLFDTQSQQIIGNKVYDIEREPRKGDEVRFETYSTSYIGASL